MLIKGYGKKAVMILLAFCLVFAMIPAYSFASADTGAQADTEEIAEEENQASAEETEEEGPSPAAERQRTPFSRRRAPHW